MKQNKRGKVLFGSLLGKKENRKNKGCCNLVFEEIEDDTEKQSDDEDIQQNTRNSCCCNK